MSQWSRATPSSPFAVARQLSEIAVRFTASAHRAGNPQGRGLSAGGRTRQVQTAALQGARSDEGRRKGGGYAREEPAVSSRKPRNVLIPILQRPARLEGVLEGHFASNNNSIVTRRSESIGLAKRTYRHASRYDR